MAQAELGEQFEHIRRVLPVGAHFTYEGVSLRVVSHNGGSISTELCGGSITSVFCRYVSAAGKIEGIVVEYADVMVSLDEAAGLQRLLRGDYPSSTGTPPFSRGGF